MKNKKVSLIVIYLCILSIFPYPAFSQIEGDDPFASEEKFNVDDPNYPGLPDSYFSSKPWYDDWSFMGVALPAVVIAGGMGLLIWSNHIKYAAQNAESALIGLKEFRHMDEYQRIREIVKNLRGQTQKISGAIKELEQAKNRVATLSMEEAEATSIADKSLTQISRSSRNLLETYGELRAETTTLIKQLNAKEVLGTGKEFFALRRINPARLKNIAEVSGTIDTLKLVEKETSRFSQQFSKLRLALRKAAYPERFSPGRVAIAVTMLSTITLVGIISYYNRKARSRAYISKVIDSDFLKFQQSWHDTLIPYYSIFLEDVIHSWNQLKAKRPDLFNYKCPFKVDDEEDLRAIGVAVNAATLMKIKEQQENGEFSSKAFSRKSLNVFWQTMLFWAQKKIHTSGPYSGTKVLPTLSILLHNTETQKTIIDELTSNSFDKFNKALLIDPRNSPAPAGFWLNRFINIWHMREDEYLEFDMPCPFSLDNLDDIMFVKDLLIQVNRDRLQMQHNENFKEGPISYTSQTYKKLAEKLLQKAFKNQKIEQDLINYFAAHLESDPVSHY